jgi:hypothetical protein
MSAAAVIFTLSSTSTTSAHPLGGAIPARRAGARDGRAGPGPPASRRDRSRRSAAGSAAGHGRPGTPATGHSGHRPPRVPTAAGLRSPDVAKLLWSIRAPGQHLKHLRVVVATRPAAQDLASGTEGAYHLMGRWLTVQAPTGFRPQVCEIQRYPLVAVGLTLCSEAFLSPAGVREQSAARCRFAGALRS